MTKRGISSGTLKIIAIIAMLLDHIGWGIIDPILLLKGVSLSDIYEPLRQISLSPVLCVLSPLFHITGRITFPIMLFALCEGVHYSKNKRKYVRNMIIFAFLSEIPFNLAFSGKLFNPTDIFTFFDCQNVFVTLTFALITLFIIQNLLRRESYSRPMRITSYFGAFFFFLATVWYFEDNNSLLFGFEPNYITVIIPALLAFSAFIIFFRKKDRNYTTTIAISLFASACFSLLTLVLDTDYAFIGVTAAAIMFLMRERKTESFVCGCAYLTINEYIEISSVLALPLIKAYNGKRGLSLKYFFYIFYPAHLVFIWALRILIL